MLEVGVNPEFQTLADELNRIRSHLADVIEERDDLVFHRAPAVKTDYILKIGSMEFEMFEIECGIARLKRKIDMVQASINQEEPVEMEIIEQALELEYAEYVEKMKRMAEEIDIAKQFSKQVSLTAEEAAELKKLYRSIAKLIHPDVNSSITDSLKSIWNRSVDAYGNGDVETLRLLLEAVSAETGSDAGGLDSGQNASALEEIKDRIEKAKKGVIKILLEIDKIKQTFPFTETTFLADPEKVSARRAELTNKIDDGRVLHKELSDRLLAMLPSSGAHPC